MNLKYKNISNLVILFSFIVFSAQATVYETVQSGNFSSTSTWVGGQVPPATLGATDTVFLVSAAPNIIMDRDLIIGHDNSMMTINSAVKVTESGKHYIAIQKGYFVQSGIMSIDSLYITGNVHNFTTINGLDTFNKLTLDQDANYKCVSNSRRYVKELLHVRSGINNTCQYQIAMAPGATIYFSDNGGLVGSQVVSLTNPYNLKYATHNQGSPGNIFDEFKGSGTTLQGIEIVGHVILKVTSQNFEIKGALKLTSGSVRFSFPAAPYFTLAFTDGGHFGSTGSGTFTGSDSVQMNFASSSPSVTNPGTVKFTPGYEKLGLLTMFLQGGASGTLTVENDLTIKSHISSTNGNLNIKNHMLDLQSSTFGITGGGTNSYIMMEPGGSVRGASSGGGILFPIGTTTKYLPLAAISQGGGTARVSVEEGVKENGTSGVNIAATQPAVDASWYLLDNTTLDEIKPGWLANSEQNSFNRNQCFVSEFKNGSWNKLSGAVAGLSSWGNYFITKAGTSTGNIYAVFDVNTDLSVEDLPKNKDVVLYPNPAINSINLNYTGNAKANMAIYDVAGRTLKTFSISNGVNTLDISALNSGVYFIGCTDEGSNTSVRFVKE